MAEQAPAASELHKQHDELEGRAFDAMDAKLGALASDVEVHHLSEPRLSSSSETETGKKVRIDYRPNSFNAIDVSVQGAGDSGRENGTMHYQDSSFGDKSFDVQYAKAGVRANVRYKTDEQGNIRIGNGSLTDGPRIIRPRADGSGRIKARDYRVGGPVHRYIDRKMAELVRDADPSQNPKITAHDRVNHYEPPGWHYAYTKKHIEELDLQGEKEMTEAHEQQRRETAS